jgi:hypothetical protein
MLVVHGSWRGREIVEATASGIFSLLELGIADVLRLVFFVEVESGSRDRPEVGELGSAYAMLSKSSFGANPASSMFAPAGR